MTTDIFTGVGAVLEFILYADELHTDRLPFGTEGQYQDLKQDGVWVSKLHNPASIIEFWMKFNTISYPPSEF
ncbi:hypothetical protein BV898_06524 [Hypsibius exemplaris]|uniref:Uncharacterized protein n=1 Tax=Hypsibius exemplaris TaxID=2072580 RepID=A0A1W0WWI0_HYPEX|nr:hypothetical protein BV898_06524 [Hypsibius exemplaris]